MQVLGTRYARIGGWLWTAKWEKPSGVLEYWSDGVAVKPGKKYLN
jgi:hypothetical protein